MGILNITPDSFSDGGEFSSVQKGVQHALDMVAAGADFIDVGAESTRPGAVEVPAEEEWLRLEPVLSALRDSVDVPISVDTYKAEVAEKALSAGAAIANDIGGLQMDERMAEVIASAGAGAVVMHNSRNQDVTGDIISSICVFFEESLRRADRAGISRDRIVLDPGIGFGKSVEENLTILRSIDRLRSFGYPLLLGASRKSVIGMTLDLPVDQRLEGTLATTVAGIAGGVDVVRVHDVEANLRASRMSDAIFRNE